jgi:non-ribosomal peptide synthetase component E (peptide arylation enzyme)
MTAWLQSAAQRYPGAPALVQGSQRLNYAELAGQASRRAAMLAGLGLRTGDRIMLEAPVTLESAIWLHALLWLGAAVIPVGPSLPPDDSARLLMRLEPSAVITSNSAQASNPAALTGGHGDLIVVDAAGAIESRGL